MKYLWALLSLWRLISTVAEISLPPKDLCGLTTFFNPFHYQTRITNYYHARRWSYKQQLKLVIVELIFGNQPAELEGDDLSKYIAIYTNNSNILWQKEALLNYGLRVLEQEKVMFENCTKIVWLDSDVIIQDGWMESTSEMLDSVQIGQVFTHLVRLPQGIFNPFAYWSEPRMKRMGFGNKEGQTQLSAALKFQGGTTGFAWAARRIDLMKVKFYDKAIVGGFDALLYHALNDPRCEVRFNHDMATDFEPWADHARQVFGTFKIGYPSKMTKAAALWHGDTKDRSYQDRHLILLTHGFTPRLHVELPEPIGGALQWTEHAPCELRKAVFDMFVSRQEDGVHEDGLKVRYAIPKYKCELVDQPQCEK
jgi:hypothetical protein